MLKTRVKTAAVLTVIVLAVLFFSYIPLVWRLFCAFLALFFLLGLLLVGVAALMK